MRIYEFSKEFDVTTKDLVDALEKEGFSGKSHMSALTQEEVNFLQKKIQKRF